MACRLCVTLPLARVAPQRGHNAACVRAARMRGAGAVQHYTHRIVPPLQQRLPHAPICTRLPASASTQHAPGLTRDAIALRLQGAGWGVSHPARRHERTAAQPCSACCNRCCEPVASVAAGCAQPQRGLPCAQL